MRRLVHAAAVVFLAAAASACGDAANPVQPPGLQPSAARASAEARVLMMDACDPATFNAVLGPGSCIRNGGVTFQNFIAQLEKHGSVGSWRFAPSLVNAGVGQELVAVNHGGEVHTFTEVEEFGGGIVPGLNALSGNPVPAPECLTLAGADFIPPGGTYSDEVEEEGTELYQCCIHPWMRATVRAR